MQYLVISIYELVYVRMYKFLELDIVIKELQVEMIFYIVCKYFGMDILEKVIFYIVIWMKNGQMLDDKEVVECGKIMNDVSCVVNEFI